MKTANNLWQLLSARANREMLMIACGVPQEILEQGSDYDKFCAYAACMPLCQGHPMLADDAELIRELLGSQIPICPDSCDALWHAAAYALTGLGEAPELPADCKISFTELPFCSARMLDLGAVLYAAPTAELLASFSGADAVSLKLSIDTFVKPNPYAAKQLLAKYERGEILTASEHDLLAAQTLRVLGKLCAERDLPLLIHTEPLSAAPWRALLQYLYRSDCLPQAVLIASSEAALHTATEIIGCVPNMTDVPQLRVCITQESLRELYQTLLPIGVLPRIERTL